MVVEKRRLRRWMTALVFGTPLYALTLNRKPPKALLGTPNEVWPGNAEIGTELLVGEFAAAGQRFIVKEFDALPRDASLRWHDYVNGFSWLGDMRALGTDPARVRARDHLGAWLDVFGAWDAVAWQPHVVGERLCSWFRHFVFLTADDPDDPLRARLLAAMAVQAKYLRRVIYRGVRDVRCLKSLKGLIFCGLCLPERERDYTLAIKVLEQEILRQINPDGGHVQRNPTVLVDVLRDFVEIRELVAAAHHPIPVYLQGAIDRIVPMVRALRHADGQMSLFNGAVEGERDAIDVTLAQAGTKSKALSHAPHTGFQRLAAGRTLIVMDTGAPPPPAFEHQAHAGLLSFEMSVGRERLIVNCGAHLRDEGQWAEALRSTAAHSTLTIDDINAIEILDDGRIGERCSAIPVTRREVDGNFYVEASHDGYRRPFGVVHTRSIYLSPEGEEVRGEDRIEGPGNQVFAVRFHLHPNVHASMVQWGKGVLIKLANGQGWQFRATGGTLRLEESVYFGNGELRRTEQIVVLGRLNGSGGVVKWGLNVVGS